MASPLNEFGILTSNDAAALLGVVPQRLHQHARAGDIVPLVRVGFADLYTLAAVEALIELRRERGMRTPGGVSA